jgi:arylsulfatase
VYDGTDVSKPFDEDVWELYHVAEDLSESRDLASEHPGKLREMQDRWWIEAAGNNVLPLDSRAFFMRGNATRSSAARRRFVYFPNGSTVEPLAVPNLRGRSHCISAEVEIPERGAEGVILAVGSGYGGFTLFTKDNRLRYVYNACGSEHYSLTSNREIPAGRYVLGFSFEKAGGEPRGSGGIARLSINGESAAEMHFPTTVTSLFGVGDSLRCGYDRGPTVSGEYRAPFTFTGGLKRVVIEVEGPSPARNFQQEQTIGLAQQ